MHKSRRVKITDINPHLTCVLCSGYLIDATTIIECLHSFCRTCIVKYLENNKYCPICDVQVHKTKPLLNIRSDQTLQDIVYKLVPGLFQNEMCRRRDLYSKHPDQKPPSAEDCGEVTQYSHIYTADESISLSLEYYNNNISYENDNNTSENKTQPHPSRRFLRCPAAVTVSHLQKLIRAKYGLSSEHRVDILYLDDRLSDDFTLMDIAYIYLWRRKGPLHLTYRIFEVAKKIKQNDEIIDKHEIKSEPTKEDEVQNEWKEVQLQISENGVMSITNISESKPETVTTNIEVKTDILPELSPIQKQEKPESKPEEIKLGKHKLDDSTDETSAKVMKPNLAVVPFKPPPVPVKNVQQLSQNHPLKMHSQITKNHVATPVTNAKIVTQNTQPTKPVNNNNNNNNGVSVQKDQITPTVQIQNNSVQNTPNLNFKIPVTTQSCTTIVTMTTTVVSSSITNLSLPNSPKYTQATTITTPKPEENKKVVPVNNCIQSSKVSIVPRKSPVKTGAYKTLRDPPKAWNPQIPRQNLTKPTLYPSNNGASTSDLNKTEKPVLTKPAKFFKMRNVPRYLGNPASGVKPLYQVREGDKSPEAKKPEIKKPETKLNNNNELKIVKSEPMEVKPKPKIEIKKQSIIKIDPKTLRPISQEIPSCSDTPEMKINQSTVPIFTPLRTQKSQTSPKIDRRSPKTTYMDIQPPKSPMDRASPKSIPKPLNSPTSKKDKLSLNFTPPNPFIPNLTSPNLAPNQFLYPNFPSYDPRVMNAYHPYSMLYAQSRLNYPGLASQNLPLSPNLMSSLNLEVNKNLRKSYEMSMMQLSPTMEVNKKTSTSVKNFEDKDKKNNLNKTVTKVETKQLTNSKNKDEKKLLQPETKPKTELENNNEKPTVETEKKVESKKENVQENNKEKEMEKSTEKPAEKAKQSTEKPNETKS